MIFGHFRPSLKTLAKPLNKILKVSKELYKNGVRIIIGPVFYKNLQYLEEIQDLIFVSLFISHGL